MTHQEQRHNLVINICELTDSDQIIWSDLINGCKYTAVFEGKKWEICCCKNSRDQRILTVNDRVSSLNEGNVLLVCEAIRRQKHRENSARQVTADALQRLRHYKQEREQIHDQ